MYNRDRRNLVRQMTIHGSEPVDCTKEPLRWWAQRRKISRTWEVAALPTSSKPGNGFVCAGPYMTEQQAQRVADQLRLMGA